MKYLRTRVEDKLRLDLFYQAHRRASRGKIHRKEVLRFNLDETGNLLRLMEIIATGRYQPSPYRRFEVYEPKQRQIMALPYIDRIVHQWAVEEFYLPYYLPRFIHDSYACIIGRGSHAAATRAQTFMRAMRQRHGLDYYILKMDISKYFYNIDQQVLLDILGRAIVDPDLMRLTQTFIRHGTGNVGIPIGNYTSQQFANIYLNELDQYCKGELGLKYYLRYMDDFVVLVHSRAEARELYDLIKHFLADRLHLRLNQKSSYYPARLGLNFAGYRLYHDYRLLRRRSKHKLNMILAAYESGRDTTERFIMRANAWHGHASHADSYGYKYRKLGGYYEVLPVVFGV